MVSPPESRAEYEAGYRIPGTSYVVLRLLGRGGMGTVYEVEDAELGKIFVLKTLHPELASRKDLVERMRREARTLAKLSHPNIVDVIAAGETMESPPLRYFVMERLRGVSLRELLQRLGPLEPRKVYEIVFDLLEALGRAHAEQLVHRDVKPENVFLHVNARGETVTKLLDFGIVAVLSSAARETGGRFIGTPRYAAPEQLNGQPVSAETDLYAVALLVFEMLTGSGPFDGLGNSNAIAEAHRSSEAPRLRDRIAVPDDVDEVIARCLEKSPKRRPASAKELSNHLFGLKSMVAALAVGETSAKTEELLRVAVAKAQAEPIASTVTEIGMAAPTRSSASSIPTEDETRRDPVVPISTPHSDPISDQPTEVDRAAATRTHATPPRATPQNDTAREPTSIPSERPGRSSSAPASAAAPKKASSPERATLWPLALLGAGAFLGTAVVAERFTREPPSAAAARSTVAVPTESAPAPAAEEARAPRPAEETSRSEAVASAARASEPLAPTVSAPQPSAKLRSTAGRPPQPPPSAAPLSKLPGAGL